MNASFSLYKYMVITICFKSETTESIEGIVYYFLQVATADSDVKPRKAPKIQNEEDKIIEENENAEEHKQEEEIEGDLDADEEDEMTETFTTSYKSSFVGPKDTPLERRALLSLEKQLELEVPESKLDLRVSQIFKKHFLKHFF